MRLLWRSRVFREESAPRDVGRCTNLLECKLRVCSRVRFLIWEGMVVRALAWIVRAVRAVRWSPRTGGICVSLLLCKLSVCSWLRFVICFGTRSSLL